MQPIRSALSALGVLTLTAASATAACTDYFEDQRFTLVVPFGAGGGYDAYARAFAPVFAETTGARLQIVNMPGGGGITGAERIANASGDDKVFGFLSTTRAYAHRITTKGSAKLTPLVGVLTEYETWIGRPETDLNGLLEGEVVAATSDLYAGIIELGLVGIGLGTEVSLVSGYDGSAEGDAAILRREVDVGARTLSSALRAQDSGDLSILITLTQEQIDGVDAPALGDVAARRAADVPEEERQKRMEYAALVANLTQNVRSFWVGDGLSDVDLACLVRAVSDVVQSDAFEAAAETVKREVQPVSHTDTVAFYNDVVAAFDQSAPLIEAYRAKIGQ